MKNLYNGCPKLLIDKERIEYFLTHSETTTTATTIQQQQQQFINQINTRLPKYNTLYSRRR